MEASEQKYYKPEIEEFHVGFLYEYNLGTHWELMVYSHNIPYDEMNPHKEAEVRVKYLDKEDIESLRFSNKNHKEIPSKSCYYKVIDDDNIYKIQVYWDMLINERENLVRIYKGKLNQYPYEEIFRGDIKNKSELKRLLKQLNILEDNERNYI